MILTLVEKIEMGRRNEWVVVMMGGGVLYE